MVQSGGFRSAGPESSIRSVRYPGRTLPCEAVNYSRSMAAQSNPAVSVDQYLNASYHPDVEYVDGVLIERGMPSHLHGIFQALLAAYFHTYRREFGFVVATEARTRIVERARYRVPDVVITPLPFEPDRVITKTPWIVVEIESPGDTAAEQRRRLRDYVQVGVPHPVLLDPEESIAYRFERGSLIETAFRSLDLPTGQLPFDTRALFEQLAEVLRGR